jgi:homoserine dehydrogenase
VEGTTLQNKLTILMALAFDKYVAPSEIPTVGITGITLAQIEEAKQRGNKIKLIASAKKEGDQIIYNVKPMELPESHPLAGVSNEFNAIFVKGNAVDELMFYGKAQVRFPPAAQSWAM